MYHYDCVYSFYVSEHLLVQKLIVVHFVVNNDEHVQHKLRNLTVVQVQRLKNQFNLNLALPLSYMREF